MDMDIVLVVVKVLIFLVTADIASWVFPAHPNIAYAGGLILGGFLQTCVPPRTKWKLQLTWALAVAIVGGLAHALVFK